MRVLIYGAGKTGTTAVFYAFQNVMPDADTSFEPKDLLKLPFDSGRDLLVKSLAVVHHERDSSAFPKFDKKILIVRHPFDRLVSFALYAPNNGFGFFDDRILARYLEILKSKLESPKSVPFKAIFDAVNDAQRGSANAHVQPLAIKEIAARHSDFFQLRYEDFVDGRLEALREHCGLAIASKPKVSKQHEKVVRSKSYGDWQKWFTPSDVEHYSEIYADYIKAFKYQTDLGETVPLSESDTIDYAIRVANQGRRIRMLPEFVPGEINMTTEGMSYQQAAHALNVGNNEAAKKIIDEVLGKRKNLAAFQFLDGRLSAITGDSANSVKHLKKVARSYPEQQIVWQLLSRELKRAGMDAEAKKAHAKAEQLAATQGRHKD
jgi:hypothetical protein